MRLPGGVRGRPARRRCTVASPAPRSPTRTAACASRWRSAPTRLRRRPRRASSRASTAPSSRRSSSCAATTAAWRPSSARSPSPAPSPTPSGYSPDLTLRAEGRAAPDPRRGRAADAGARAAARAAGRAADPQAHPRGRRVGRRRSSSASTCCAARWTRSARSWARTTLGRRRVPHQDRRGRDARGRPRAGRARARPAGADGRLSPASRR